MCFGEADADSLSGIPCAENLPPIELPAAGLAPFDFDWRALDVAECVPFVRVVVGVLVPSEDDADELAEIAAEVELPPATVVSLLSTPHSERLWSLGQHVTEPDLRTAQYWSFGQKPT